MAIFTLIEKIKSQDTGSTKESQPYYIVTFLPGRGCTFNQYHPHLVLPTPPIPNKLTLLAPAHPHPYSLVPPQPPTHRHMADTDAYLHKKTHQHLATPSLQQQIFRDKMVLFQNSFQAGNGVYTVIPEACLTVRIGVVCCSLYTPALHCTPYYGRSPGPGLVYMTQGAIMPLILIKRDTTLWS